MDIESLNARISGCRSCPRLVAWREEVARTRRKAYQDQEYWGRPVPGFGDPRARVLVVGLAPGAHGSNRTGRMFTGDASGDFLFPALHRAGFATRASSHSRDDGLALVDLYLTAALRCVPPGNRPAADELDACRPYLEREFALLKPRVAVALGRIAFDSIMRLYSSRPVAGRFAHGARFPLAGGPWLVCSYHPSRQNTQTGRLTAGMFDAVWAQVNELLEQM